MKKLTTMIVVLSLVLGGVALAAAADLVGAELNGFTKISDQEAQEISGKAMSWNNYGDLNGVGDRLRDGSCSTCPGPQIQPLSTTSTPQNQTRSRLSVQINLPAGTPMHKRPGNSW